MSFNPAVENATRGVSIERWTDETIDQLEAVRISAVALPEPLQRATVSLSIPLDDDSSKIRPNEQEGGVADRAAARSKYLREREPRRRDSLKRRDALLKGKEGSRRRQKWENDRLIGNPWAEPPEPRDWDIRPTYPVHAVPYFLAPLWDERQVSVKKRAVEKAKRTEHLRKEQTGNVPKDLRERLKRSKGAKGLLQDIEEQVRDFVQMWEAKEQQLRQDGLADADSSEDEEIVFVGRNGQMNDSHTFRTSEGRLQRDRLVFDSLVDDHGASFGRWLVHIIASHYNLRTWSITTGNPARREAYIGISDQCKPMGTDLPRPLYGLV